MNKHFKTLFAIKLDALFIKQMFDELYFTLQMPIRILDCFDNDSQNRSQQIISKHAYNNRNNNNTKKQRQHRTNGLPDELPNVIDKSLGNFHNATALNKFALTQPLNSNIFFAGNDGHASMERILIGLRIRIAKEQGMTLFRSHNNSSMGKTSSTARFNIIQINNDRCDTLTATLQCLSRAGQFGIKIIIMGLILSANPITQNLNPLTIHNRPIKRQRDSILDLLNQSRFAAPKKHALRGTPLIFTLNARCAMQYGGRIQTRTGRGNEGITFSIAKEPTQKHDARGINRQQNVDFAAGQIKHTREIKQIRLRRRYFKKYRLTR